jgi:hypothetical protein
MPVPPCSHPRSNQQRHFSTSRTPAILETRLSQETERRVSVQVPESVIVLQTRQTKKKHLQHLLSAGSVTPPETLPKTPSVLRTYQNGPKTQTTKRNARYRPIYLRAGALVATECRRATGPQFTPHRAIPRPLRHLATVLNPPSGHH